MSKTKFKGPLPSALRWQTVQAYTETRTTMSLTAYPRSKDECLEIIEFARQNNLSICSRGSGYTYGDMILNDLEIILNTSPMNRILNWDKDSGIIVVEPGVKFSDIFRLTLPDNWTLHSCPGGMAVTVGGAVSNNVHGKDSWKNGNFGDHVLGMKLLTSGGDIISVDRVKDQRLFNAVIGGMGLLGIVLEITIQLGRAPSAFVEVSSVSVRNMEESIGRLEEAKRDYDFSIAWADAFSGGNALGRGYVVSAKWIDKKIPVDARRFGESLTMPTRIFGMLPSKPTWYLLRPFFRPSSIKIANKVNYLLSKIRSQKKQTLLFTEYNFMHNRIPDLKHVYRPYGFIEFQPLIPRAKGIKAVREVFELCQRYGFESLLCGVKAHKEDGYLISYSGDGYSIGIDIQLRGRDLIGVKDFSRKLFEYTAHCGGKTFLAKDELLPRDIFEKMYPRYREFLEVKKSIDPEGLFKSDMYRRLLESR